jgi:GntR family transcriptional regulator
MLEKQSYKPIYLQIADNLIKNIKDGTWEIGATVPSEHQLMKQFQISRNTARDALNEIEQHGYIYRVPGKGSFVASIRLDQHYNFLNGFSQDVAALGMTPSHTIFEIKTVKATPFVAAKLQIAPGSNVLYMHRLLLADDLPYIVVRSYLTSQWLEINGIEISAELLGHGSFYEYLDKKYNIVFNSAVNTLRAGAANAEDAEILRIPPGHPVLLSERISRTDDNIPRELTLGVGHPDRHQWTVMLFKKANPE